MLVDGGGAEATLAQAALPAGSAAPAFALHDSPHSSVTLEDFRGRVVVLVFHGADWHPVAAAQLALYQELLPHVERLGAVVLGISVDGTCRIRSLFVRLGYASRCCPTTRRLAALPAPTAFTLRLRVGVSEACS